MKGLMELRREGCYGVKPVKGTTHRGLMIFFEDSETVLQHASDLERKTP